MMPASIPPPSSSQIPAFPPTLRESRTRKSLPTPPDVKDPTGWCPSLVLGALRISSVDSDRCRRSRGERARTHLKRRRLLLTPRGIRRFADAHRRFQPSDERGHKGSVDCEHTGDGGAIPNVRPAVTFRASIVDDLPPVVTPDMRYYSVLI